MSNTNNVSATSSLEPTATSQEPPTIQFHQSGLVRGANCRLLPTNQTPAPTRPRERIMSSQGPAPTSAREPTTGSPPQPTSGFEEPTMESLQKLVTESRGGLISTEESRHFFTQLHKHDMRVDADLPPQIPTEESRHFFTQLHKQDMRADDDLPPQIRQESREPTSIPTMESRHFFSQPQIRDVSFNTFRSLLIGQESGQQEEPRVPTTSSPQATIPSNSQPQTEQNVPRQQEASGMGPDTPELRANRPESYETEELRDPTLRRLSALVNNGAAGPWRQATAQQIQQLDVQMQRLAEVEQSSRRLRRVAPAMQLNREAFRQNQLEQHEMEDPQASTRRRRRPLINTRNAELMRQSQRLDAGTQHLADEVAGLRASQQPAAPSVAGLQTPEEQAQRQEKAQRHLRDVRLERQDEGRVLNGLPGVIVAANVVSLMVQVCVLGLYFWGGF